MSCANWKNSLIGRLYGEIEADDAAALTAHLETCAGCRETLEEFGRVRTTLREDAQQASAAPRVVILRDRPRLRFAALAASVLGAALLAGAGAGAGYALGLGAAPAPTATTTAVPAAPNAATEELVRREVDRRLATLGDRSAVARKSGEDSVSSPELRAELAKLEKKINGQRAADLDYVLDQIGASEFRTGTRIGKTNEALRTVALASNPYANEQ
jgi:hypothetical protein